MTDEEQIRAVVAERVTAMRERDAERFVARYAPQTVKFDLAPPLAHPGPEARDAEALRSLTGTIAGYSLTIVAWVRR